MPIHLVGYWAYYTGNPHLCQVFAIQTHKFNILYLLELFGLLEPKHKRLLLHIAKELAQ